MARKGPRVSRSYVLRAAAPFAVALVTVALIVAAAGAHDTDIRDPDDARGRLDVQQVRLAHQPGPPIWTVFTFGVWRNAEMWDRGYIMVLLDTSGGERAEYYLLVRSVGSKVEGSLWRARAYGPDSYLGSVPVARPSPRSASIQVGLVRLKFGPSRSIYRWWVQTVYTSETCRQTCHDRAPNGDPVEQWRPGMSPTPSPTKSSSGSSTP
jgi:hypothetical protein